MARCILYFLIGASAAICAYLLFRRLNLAESADVAAVDVCSEWFGRGCDPALESPLGNMLGLPLAGWGIVHYGTLAALLTLGRLMGNGFERVATAAALALATVAAGASVLLSMLMLSGTVPFCPLCALSHALNLATVPLLLWTSNLSVRQCAGALRSATVPAILRGPSSASARWQGVGFFCTALVGVALYQWVYIEVQRRSGRTNRSFDPELLWAEYRANSTQELPLGPDEASLGPEYAPLRLIVFSDFQCGGCRRFAGELGTLRQRFGDELQIVFKNFPLSTACNPALQRDLHPHACEAARAAEAARRQGKFWEMHDALFASRLKQPDSFGPLAMQAGLDPEQFERDVATGSAAARVQQDVELGRRIGVDRTPTVFLNGRRMPDTRLAPLAFVIERELRQAREDAIAAP